MKVLDNEDSDLCVDTTSVSIYVCYVFFFSFENSVFKPSDRVLEKAKEW